MTDKTQGSGKESDVKIKWQITPADWSAVNGYYVRASPEVSSTEAKDVVWTTKVSRECQTNFYYCWIISQFGEGFTMVRANYSIYFIDKAGERVSVVTDCDRDFIKPSTGGRAMLCEDLPSDIINKSMHNDGSRMLIAEIRFTSLRVEEQASRQWVIKFSEFCDDVASSNCSIEIGDTTLPAHKSMLMAHSPVFRAMFTNPLAEECESGVVKVTDCKEPEPMKALIRYCYQGYVDVATMDGEWSKEIFELASKYRIDDLKAIMEKRFIEKRLNVENASGMAVLADMHSAVKLKEASIKLIASGGDAVFEIAEWKERSDKELIAKVFELSDKFSIAELKTQLQEHFIRKRLSVENVVPMAVLADKHSAEKLQEACVKLIAREWKVVFESSDWKELKRVRPELAADLAEGATRVIADGGSGMVADGVLAGLFSCSLTCC